MMPSHTCVLQSSDSGGKTVPALDTLVTFFFFNHQAEATSESVVTRTGMTVKVAKVFPLRQANYGTGVRFPSVWQNLISPWVFVTVSVRQLFVSLHSDGDSCDGSDHHSTHPLQPVEISQVAQDMPKLRSPAGTCDVTPLSDSYMFLFLLLRHRCCVQRRTSYLFRRRAGLEGVRSARYDFRSIW